MPTLAPRRSRETADPTEASASAPARLARRRRSRRTLIALAVVGSLLLHLLLIFVLAWVLPHWPRKALKPGNAPFHLSIVRSPEEEKKDANAPANQAAPYIRTPDQEKQEKPDDPKFISSNDTREAAEKAAEANKPPLPSQDGREIPTYDFDTHLYRPGKEAADAATSAASAASEQNASTPNQTPQPDRKTTAKNSRTKTSPRNAAPTPTPAPDGELATVKSQPTPANEPPRPEETPSDTPPPPMARQSSQAASQANPATVTSPGLAKRPGYQPQTIQSKATGSISNRGKSAPSAIATPLGRYEKAVQDAIGSMWYLEVDRQMSYLVHTQEVKLHFYVTRSGRVRGVRVSGGDPNNTLTSLSIGAVSEAEILPIPPDVAALLPAGELEEEMSFQFYIQ